MQIPRQFSVKPFDRHSYSTTLAILEQNKLNTVCIEANCPNRYECFAGRRATFMILGNICTRNCSYCGVKKGVPAPVDEGESTRIAQAVESLGLNYCVVTCVTRDDLTDGGAGMFVKTVRHLRKRNPCCRIEVLISDLNSNWEALKHIVQSKPDIINHNIEVVRELFPLLRPQGNYHRSLELLKKVKEFSPETMTKSGIMVGLGETKAQVIGAMHDLRTVQCDMLTIGQYLQPSEEQVSVKKYYTQKEFDEFKSIGLSLGFRHVESGPLVRSSYMADTYG